MPYGWAIEPFGLSLEAKPRTPSSIYLENCFFWALGRARATLDAFVHVDEGMAVDHRDGLCGTDVNARLTRAALVNIYLVHSGHSSLSMIVSAIIGRCAPA